MPRNTHSLEHDISHLFQLLITYLQPKLPFKMDNIAKNKKTHFHNKCRANHWFLEGD